MHPERETGQAEQCLSRVPKARELSSFLIPYSLTCSQSYINRHTIPAIREFFPQMKLEMLDAGHWGAIRSWSFFNRHSSFVCVAHAERYVFVISFLNRS